MTKNNSLIPLEIQIQTKTKIRFRAKDNKIFDLEVTKNHSINVMSSLKSENFSQNSPLKQFLW